MNALADFCRPYRRGMTRYFFLSGLCLAGFFAYVALWSVGAQWLRGDDLFGIGTPVELLLALRGAGLTVVLVLAGAVWLLMTGFAARGAALRRCERHIAELEAKVRELSRL